MTSTVRRRITPLLFALLVPALLGLNACDKPIDYSVVIEYEEAAVFSEFDAPPAPGAVPVKTFASGGIFVAYRIVSIQNTGAGAKDFSFDPNKLFAGTPASKMAGGVLAPYSTVKPMLVAKGTTAPSIGRLIINVSGDPKDLTTADNNLLYESGAGESVLFNRRPVAKKVLDPAVPGNLP